MPIQICAVPDCSRPGYNDGVCTMHRDEAERAYAIGVLAEVGRDLEIEINLARYYAIDAPSGPIHISAVPASWQAQGGTPYGRVVLAKTVEKIATAANGTRNETLNRCSFLIAGYVAGGEIAADVALLGLQKAAQGCELPAREAQSTIRSGWQKGLQRPLSAPSR